MVKCAKCGKDISSRGIKTHERYCKISISDTYKSNVSDTSINTENTYPEKKKDIIGIDIKEVNMSSEYTEKKDVIEPKKDEPAFQCGACNAQFVKKPRFCNNCGCEFE